jgi:transposase
MYDAMTRLKIQHLRGAGLGVEETAKAAGVSSRTVERVSAEPPIEDLGRAQTELRSGLGRPSEVEPYRERIVEWLRLEPTLKSVAILQRLRDEGYDSGKSAAYAAIKALRPAAPTPLVARFEGVPGEFSQHDFGQHVVEYDDGSRERVRFFASRLKYSRLMHVRLVTNEKTETVCHSLVCAFEYFGGMPLVCVFDNPRTIVIEHDGAGVRWQETFAQFSFECGFASHANWPERPQEKGSVEKLVGFVKSTFFKAYRFRDRRDLEQKLAAWHVWANDERVCRATKQTPRARMLLEGGRLRPMKLDAKGYTLRYSRVVRTDGYVEHEGRRYYAGGAHVGQTVLVRVGEREVSLWTGATHVATHPRTPLNARYSVLPSQRAELLEKPGARAYVKRTLLADMCPAAQWYMTEIRHRRPELWREDVEQIFALLESHGEQRVRDALVEAAAANTVGVEYLEALLLGQGRLEVRS